MAAAPLNKKVLDMMDQYGFDPFYRQLVLDGQNGGITSNMVFQSEISSGRHAIQKNLRDFIFNTLQVTEGSSYGGLLYSKLYEQQSLDLLTLVSLEIHRENFGAASSLLSNNSGLFREEDARDDVLLVVIDVLQRTAECAYLDGHQKQQLELITESNYLGSAMAKAALYRFTEEYSEYWEPVILVGSNHSAQHKESFDAEEFKQSILEIRPNPSDQDATLLITLPDGMIGGFLITDQSGRTIAEIKDISESRFIDLSQYHVRPGMYICSFLLDDRPIATEKWIV